MTKWQHFIAFLIMLPGVPFALPLSLLVVLTRWAYIASEGAYDFVGSPFLYLNRKWALRCERVNKDKLK